jgi:hypothetical protein
LKDHGSVVSCVRSATLESKGYISGFEGFNVVDALANNGDFLGGFLRSPSLAFFLFGNHAVVIIFCFGCIQAL